MLNAAVFVVSRICRERAAIAQFQPCNGTLRGFDRLMQLRLFTQMPLDPVSPVAVRIVVVQLVVNHFSNEIGRIGKRSLRRLAR
jgi:hypothetical protein